MIPSAVNNDDKSESQILSNDFFPIWMFRSSRAKLKQR
jgi:hypothetical protein